jgi:hypothetical protein
MGIAFTEIAEPDRPRLDELITRLSSGSVSTAECQLSGTETQAVVPDLLMVTDAKAALGAVAKYFQSNRFLSREEFTDLVTKNQNSEPRLRR